MKSYQLLGAVFFLLFLFKASASVFYVNVGNVTPASPYANWATAATNIQDAIDVSTNGDIILVTNGIYQVGGRVMAGNLMNRVVLNKPVTLQSVNGPGVTTIQGAGAINGTAAVRCAWLTNGAYLVGFTLTGGATRSTGNQFSLESGGGIWCASSNAFVWNCLIVSNTAYSLAGGVYQGTVISSLISSNGTTYAFGGAAYESVLNNCTITSNTTYGAVYPIAMTNCIIYFNVASGVSFGNYVVGGTAFSHCCTTPALAGTGNFTNAPQLFADGVHLTATSPCIGAGTHLLTGTDIFGQTWANPPSVGCAEWRSAPIVTQPQIHLTSNPIGFTVGNLAFTGQSPFTFSWLKDGASLLDNGHFNSTQTTNLVVTGASFADAGNYQLVITNSFGVITSEVTQLVIHCVDIAGTNPVAPYISWTTAATNIQDAITASSIGDVVLVTNGIYAIGGKSMDGVITNRISVDKAILVQGVNGPNATAIQGAWDTTSTNGPSAVRCAWLTNNAILSGFTLQGGATRKIVGSVNQSVSGGGVFRTSNNAVVGNCMFATNFASYVGGGAFSVTLNQCTLTGNHAYGSGMAGAGLAGAGSGGGTANCNLYNCLLSFNIADQESGGGALNCNLANCTVISNKSALYGSGVYQGILLNCTVTGNRHTSFIYSAYGGAVANATLTNCIVYGNFFIGSGSTNYASCTFSYSDTDPLPSGPGNIDVNPLFLADGVHLSSNSPCINAGKNSAVTLTNDLDGNSRIVGGTVDMDAYEYQTPTSIISYAWLQQYGLPNDGSADYADSDDDGMNNWQEWIAGTIPTNVASVLQLSSPSNSISGMTVTWQSVTNVTYYLQRSSDLSVQPAFSSIQSNIVGQAGSTSYTDTNAVGSGPFFYRVGVQ